MYMYLSLTTLHICMKYENCTLKITQGIVSVPKCWQSSVLISTFHLLTPICMDIFLSPSCIYVWNMRAVLWKLLQLSCQNQSVDKVQLWPWPLWPQNVHVYISHHPASMYETWKLYVENYSSYCVKTKVIINFSYDIDLWPFDINVKHKRTDALSLWHQQ